MNNTTFNSLEYIKTRYTNKVIKSLIDDMNMSEEIVMTYLTECTTPTQVDEMLLDYTL